MKVNEDRINVHVFLFNGHGKIFSAGKNKLFFPYKEFPKFAGHLKLKSMNNLIIDLRSDTVTRPSPEMLKAMMNATVGDDVLGDDPTVMELEVLAAGMLGKEAGLFCPSGTMTNQIAMRVHARPGDEVICDQGSHVYRYEGGGIAFNSGCSVRLVEGNRGRITPQQIIENINPNNVHHPRTSLVVVENTCNRGGGSYYTLPHVRELSVTARDNGLAIHLDGARLFNALIETGEKAIDHGHCFDSVSICLSKGLGAPVGSVLLGNDGFIREARRVRKLFGGGMRQAGYLAAAGIYSLKNNISSLKEDHLRAKELEKILRNKPYITEVLPVDTNIVVFKLVDEWNDVLFLETLKQKGMLALGFGPQTIRMITHLDFTDEMLEKSKKVLSEIV
jgi:threonine aldolase